MLHLLSPFGFRAAGVYAGIKTRHSADVGLLLSEFPADAAGVFTTNKVHAAPVRIGLRHVKDGALRGVVVNSGNANACTGEQGYRDAMRMCELAAKIGRCAAEMILPSSTGIIGHLLPMDKIESGIQQAGMYLGDSLEHAQLFGDAIMTTDTRRKAAAVELKLNRKKVILAGIAKGAGMIGPRMSLAGPGDAVVMRAGGGTKASARALKGRHATMLAFLTTDARIPAGLLRKMLSTATERSFNAVTIDDHTSTNDTALLLASGASGAKISAGSSDARKFQEALNEVCESLAKQIAADGEGATKVVKVIVDKAKSPAAAAAIARTIANSPLVKCAMHGNDPNWGRIVSAAGYAGVAFDPQKCRLVLAGTPVFAKGQPLAFDKHEVSGRLAAAEVTIHLTCNIGKAAATVWTCDLSKDYVTINADYHT